MEGTAQYPPTLMRERSVPNESHCHLPCCHRRGQSPHSHPERPATCQSGATQKLYPSAMLLMISCAGAALTQRIVLLFSGLLVVELRKKWMFFLSGLVIWWLTLTRGNQEPAKTERSCGTTHTNWWRDAWSLGKLWGHERVSFSLGFWQQEKKNFEFLSVAEKLQRTKQIMLVALSPKEQASPCVGSTVFYLQLLCSLHLHQRRVLQWSIQHASGHKWGRLAKTNLEGGLGYFIFRMLRHGVIATVPNYEDATFTNI